MSNSEENKNSPKPNPKTDKGSVEESKINYDRAHPGQSEINKGFTFEVKPQKPSEKPKTDGGTTQSE